MRSDSRLDKTLNGIFLLEPELFGVPFDMVYGPAEQEEIGRLVRIYAGRQTRASVKQAPSVLAEADVILAGWNCPPFDAGFLAAAGNLKAVFYAAGGIGGIVTEAFWDRGIVISSAAGANAVPVAEFTLSQILFGLKRGWYYVLEGKRQGKWAERVPIAGAFGSTVGIVSLGMIGRRVCELLKAFDVNVLAYSSSADAETASELNVTLCALGELFRRSDVVSVYTAALKETEGMITGEHLASMRQGATFINAARGSVVRQNEMIEVLRRRPDLYAVLDVTKPEPPEPGSALYSLHNVVLTPHIAGSMGLECRRMGRYLKGEPLRWAITREQSRKRA